MTTRLWLLAPLALAAPFAAVRLAYAAIHTRAGRAQKHLVADNELPGDHEASGGLDGAWMGPHGEPPETSLLADSCLFFEFKTTH